MLISAAQRDKSMTPEADDGSLRVTIKKVLTILRFLSWFKDGRTILDQKFELVNYTLAYLQHRQAEPRWRGLPFLRAARKSRSSDPCLSEGMIKSKSQSKNPSYSKYRQNRQWWLRCLSEAYKRVKSLALVNKWRYTVNRQHDLVKKKYFEGWRERSWSGGCDAPNEEGSICCIRNYIHFLPGRQVQI